MPMMTKAKEKLTEKLYWWKGQRFYGRELSIMDEKNMDVWPLDGLKFLHEMRVWRLKRKIFYRLMLATLLKGIWRNLFFV